MGAGDEVSADDLVATRVRFADGGGLEGYFTVDDELPADLELTRAVGAGELLPRAAVGSPGERHTVQLPIAVDPEQVPGSVESGSVVDVYLVSRKGGPALTGATVVDAPPLEEAFTTTGKRQVVLAVAEEDAQLFLERLGRLDDPVITVVRRG
jgi:hypothetical protein